MDHRPLTMAVVASLMALSIAVVLTLAIGGSYLLVLHVLHSQETAAATAQIRASVPTCQALRGLAPSTTGELAAAFQRVYAATHCQVILTGIARHEPLTQILQQLGGR